MTTATTEQPFFRTVDDPWAERQPQNSRLRLPIEPTCELTPELNDKVSDYFDDANTLEAAIAKLHSDRAKLCADHAKSIMQVVQGGEDLLGRQSELSHELTALLWRRFALLNELVPAHRKALEAARVEADAAIRSELSKYAQYGLTPETMPAAQQGRLDQAEIQLRQKAKSELFVMVADAAVIRCEGALEAIVGAAGVAPRCKHAVIDWKPLKSAFDDRVAQLAGLTLAYTILPPILSVNGQYMQGRFGFANSPLTKEHIAALEGLGNLFPNNGIGDKQRLETSRHCGGARSLLAKLPRTKEVASYMA